MSIFFLLTNKMKKGLHIGTSGWSYGKDWKGVFYSSGTSMLQQYLLYFDTAEINSTFYALPKPNFIKHLSTVNKNKFFTAKLPKKVTHDHRLDLTGDGGLVLDEFFELMHPIEERVEVLLIQLPPWDISTMASLETFFASLRPQYRYAIEFRHESWLKKSVWSLLEQYDIANVIVDEPRLPVDLRITTDFSYIRWHGQNEKLWYNYRYSLDQLKAWIPRLEQVSNSVAHVFGYFNNHFAGNAPLNALQLLSLLGTINPRQEHKLMKMLESDAVQQTSLNDFV
ncbi:MAG: DUF72 domain-containing protein [Candidatus Thorarchaeota archaeon]